MSNCELKIVVDRPGGTYSGGEMITGAVRVTALKDCECRKLTLMFRWSAAGQGDSDYGDGQERTLFTGKWQSGEQASYPFEFKAPLDPGTYHGSLFSVDWIVSSSADIRLGLDQKAEEKLVLVPSASQADVPLSPKEEIPAWQGTLQNLSEMTTSASLWRRPAIGAVLLYLSVTYGWQIGADFLREHGWAELRNWTWDDTHDAFLVKMLLCLGVAVIGGRMLPPGLRRLLAKRKLGAMDVTVDPKTVRRGQSVSCKVRFRPRTDIALTEATAALIAAEEVIITSIDSDSSNPRTQTSRHGVYRQKMTLSPEQHVQAGAGVELDSTIQVPSDAPFTFMASKNRLLWSVHVDLKLSGGLDWSQDFPIVVRP